MQRYTANKTYMDGKRLVFATSKLPTIPKSNRDRYIFTREGDRLDQLANEFYEDPRLWPYLAMANNVGKGSLNLKPGIQLRIPHFSTVRDIEELFAKAERER